MRTLLAALGALLASLAHAQAPAPERRGYAHDNARVLAEQRLFGIAHGVSLLAAACRELPDVAERVGAAYSAWRAREEMAIDLAAAGVARYHFGAVAAQADWAAIASALNLREKLDLTPESAQLHAACATLPEALVQPRYALGERLRLEELMTQVAAAVEVDARERHCSKQVPPAARAVHAARYDNWREINQQTLDQAQADLAAAWPDDAPQASFEAWLAELRRQTRVGGDVADCLWYSETLKQPQAALRNAFSPPPPQDALP